MANQHRRARLRLSSSGSNTKVADTTCNGSSAVSNTKLYASGIKCFVCVLVFVVTYYGVFQALESSSFHNFQPRQESPTLTTQSLSLSLPTTTTTSNNECLTQAKAQNAAYLQQNLVRFWGNESYMEVLLERLGKEPLARDYNVFVDVGAGSYAAAGGDISLSLLFDKLFPAIQKTVVAFEPFPEAYEKLQHEYQTYMAHNNHRQDLFNYTLLQEGCGVTEAPMVFRGAENIMTANKRVALHPLYSGKISHEIPSTSIQALGLSRINILKTDTEGLEWEVLLGAKPMLQRHQIDLVFFAYEDKWTFDSIAAAYPVMGSFIKEQLELDTPNLKSVSSWLESLGYASYLIGLAPLGQEGFVAIPVSGDYWQDSYEVGRDPKSYGFHYTWMDAIAVPKAGPLQQWIEQQSQPHAMTCPQ